MKSFAQLTLERLGVRLDSRASSSDVNREFRSAIAYLVEEFLERNRHDALESRDEVNYQEVADDTSQPCALCKFYIPGYGCRIVGGEVSPMGTCDRWDGIKAENAPRLDSREPTKRILNWRSLKIGVTHPDGESVRFGQSVRGASYGRVYRSYGAAEDKKSIDCWVGPDVRLGEDDNPTAFWFHQLNPADGGLDEQKLVIGFRDRASAKQAIQQNFPSHLRSEMFGGLHPVDEEELRQYRYDAEVREDIRLGLTRKEITNKQGERQTVWTRVGHLAEHGAESVASWKVGKVVGGAIANVAASHGADFESARLMAETGVQALTATALHLRNPEHRNGVEVATKFVAEAAAAFAGKVAHGTVDQAVASYGASERVKQLSAIAAGKITGITTNVAANKSGIAGAIAGTAVFAVSRAEVGRRLKEQGQKVKDFLADRRGDSDIHLDRDSRIPGDVAEALFDLTFVGYLQAIEGRTEDVGIGRTEFVESQDSDDDWILGDSEPGDFWEEAEGDRQDSDGGKYAHINFTPPEGVRNAAKRGLELRKAAPKSRKGGLSNEQASKEGIGSGVQRAVNLANGSTLSPSTVKRMKAFFDRHSAFKSKHETSPPNKSYISWLLWGGDSGYSWAKKVVARMEAADEKAKQERSDATRPHCIACTVKHISTGIALMHEVDEGYADHAFLVFGELYEAEKEAMNFSPDLAAELRQLRKQYWDTGESIDFRVYVELLKKYGAWESGDEEEIPGFSGDREDSLSKDDVNYSDEDDGRPCLNCVHWGGLTGEIDKDEHEQGRCKLLRDKVWSLASCDRWQQRERATNEDTASLGVFPRELEDVEPEVQKEETAPQGSVEGKPRRKGRTKGVAKKDELEFVESEEERLDVTFTDEGLHEKAKSEAKSKFRVYPSAYANAWMVKRYKELYEAKHGKAAGAFKDSKGDSIREDDLDKWFKEKWVEIGVDGEIIGECGGRSEEDDRGKPKCLPEKKAKAMSVEDRKAIARRKRREDPDANRSGAPVMVSSEPPKKDSEEEEEGDRPTTDAEEQDLADMLAEDAAKKSAPILNDWLEVVEEWVTSQDSLEDARKNLTDSPKNLFDRIPEDRFTESLRQALLISELAGRAEVLDEITREDAVREDAKRPEWLKLPFQEAIAYFRKKISLPAKSYKALDDRIHDYAFMVSNLTKAEILDDARWLVERAIADGASQDDFNKQWDRLIGRKGWQVDGSRRNIIFQQNVRAAYGRGREQQMRDPAVLNKRSLWLWRHGDSPDPRPTHLALHNKAIPADHLFWKTVGSPPSGFGCRCRVMSITEDYAKRNGIEVLKNPPDPKTVAEPGFRKGLMAMNDEERKEAIAEIVSKFPPTLKGVVDEKLGLNTRGDAKRRVWVKNSRVKGGGYYQKREIKPEVVVNDFRAHKPGENKFMPHNAKNSSVKPGYGKAVDRIKVEGVFSNELYTVRGVKSHPIVDELRKEGNFGYHTSAEDFVKAFGINPIPEFAIPPKGDFFYVHPEMIGLGRVVDKVMLGSRAHEEALNSLVENGFEVFGTFAVEGRSTFSSESSPVAKSTVGNSGVHYEFVVKDKSQPSMEAPICFFTRHPETGRFTELTGDKLELLDQAKKMGEIYGSSLDRSRLSGQQESQEALDKDISRQGFSQGETAVSRAAREQFLSEVRNRRKFKVDPVQEMFSEIPLDDPSPRLLDGDVDDEWLHSAFNAGASPAATPKGKEMTRAIQARDRNVEISQIAKESGLSKPEARREWQQRMFKERVERLRSEGKIN